MTLTLSVLRCPDHAVPETRRVSGGDYAIGRGAECDWPLADPDRVLSKRHCILEFRGGGWQVRDLSTNGTYVNHASQPVGRDQAAVLNDGDRLRLGSYEIEVRVEAAADAAGAGPSWGAAPLPGVHAEPRRGPPPGGAPDPFAVAPFAAGADPFADPLFGGAPAPAAAAAPLLPADFDPFADDAPPMPDHRPTTGDAFLAPRSAQAPPVLPDDWDIDLAPPGQIPGVAASPPQAARAAGPPRSSAAPGPVPEPSPVAASPFAAAPVLAPGAIAAPAAPAPTAVPAVPPDAALAAFLAGAGLAPAAVAASARDPEAALRDLGAAFRAAVGGLRALLIARADVKREFRIEQTMLRTAGNNPVKFAATDEAAVAALAGAGNAAPRAVAEAVADLSVHQVASLAATQAAARALLDRVAPAAVEASAPGGGGVFGGGREKRLWEAYRRLHAQVTEQFEDDFDSAFGKAFARAYEQAAAARRDTG